MNMTWTRAADFSAAVNSMERRAYVYILALKFFL